MGMPGGGGAPSAPKAADSGPLSKEELDKLSRQNTALPEPSDVDYDPPLIQCMAGLFKLHGKPVSTRLLSAGLPKTSGPLHPSACIRAAQAAGMRAKTVYRPTLAQISPLTLPCILLLQGDKACGVLRPFRVQQAQHALLIVLFWGQQGGLAGRQGATERQGSRRPRSGVPFLPGQLAEQIDHVERTDAPCGGSAL